LDPLGDVTLTLKKPNAPFAVWRGAGTGSPSPATAEGATIHGPVTFLVSSRHLALASPVFSTALKMGGPRDISIRGWDAEAMAIVMSIIHHKGPQIPSKVGLELLGRIATVVDHYQMHEAVQQIGASWVRRLRTPLPNSYGRDLILWLYIALVFRDDDIFRHATKVAIRHCPGDMETLQLPIPSTVIGKTPFAQLLERSCFGLIYTALCD
jgi:hypothetical protein